NTHIRSHSINCRRVRCPALQADLQGGLERGGCPHRNQEPFRHQVRPRGRRVILRSLPAAPANCTALQGRRRGDEGQPRITHRHRQSCEPSPHRPGVFAKNHLQKKAAPDQGTAFSFWMIFSHSALTTLLCRRGRSGILISTNNVIHSL